MGLPGSGKTTLAKLLAPKLNAVWHNADNVRRNPHINLGYSEEDRLDHSRRLGYWADRVIAAGHYSVTDFICPTPETREAFNADFIIWIDRIKAGRYDDTNKLFTPPEKYDVKLTKGTPEEWLEIVLKKLDGWDSKAPTVQLLGRFQPFHEGHLALAKNAIAKVGQVAICIRDTHGTSNKDPFNFRVVKRNIEERMDREGYKGKYKVIFMPNITNIHYGRDVGYKIEQIRFGRAIESISATHIRNSNC